MLFNDKDQDFRSEQSEKEEGSEGDDQIMESENNEDVMMKILQRKVAPMEPNQFFPDS